MFKSPLAGAERRNGDVINQFDSLKLQQLLFRPVFQFIFRFIFLHNVLGVSTLAENIDSDGDDSWSYDEVASYASDYYE
jgi:hypothetical protein